MTTLQKYISAKNPGCVIKPIIGDGYCVIRSVQEGLRFCYGKVESLDSLLVELKIMKNYDFYLMFSTKDVNVFLSELDSFLKIPLKYNNKDTVDLFLIALGNAYNCRTIIYECTSTHLWKTDLSKDSGNYEKTLYFAKTDLNHLDVVIPAEPTETGNDSDDTDVVPEQIETEPDDDVTITKVVESSLYEMEFLGRKSIKIESDESQCEDNSNSDSEISLEKIRIDVLSSFIKTRKED